MATYTEEQKRIAVLLMHGPKSIEELQKQLNMPQEGVMNDLKGMLKLKVVEKHEGFPVKYKLIDNISSTVHKRKEIEETDPNRLRIRAIIEAQAVEENLLMKALSDIEAGLKKEKEFTIYDSKKADVVQDGEQYSSYIDLNLSVRNFRALVRFMYFYGPSSVEVLKPAKFDIPADDLQDGLMDMAEMIQAYNSHVLNLMGRKELAEFNNKLYEKKRQ
ncbi:MAG: hypothetical protein ABH854_02160 [Candidatus Diapherotrites archaeon]